MTQYHGQVHWIGPENLDRAGLRVPWASVQDVLFPKYFFLWVFACFIFLLRPFMSSYWLLFLRFRATQWPQLNSSFLFFLGFLNLRFFAQTLGERVGFFAVRSLEWTPTPSWLRSCCKSSPASTARCRSRTTPTSVAWWKGSWCWCETDIF